MSEKGVGENCSSFLPPILLPQILPHPGLEDFGTNTNGNQIALLIRDFMAA